MRDELPARELARARRRDRRAEAPARAGLASGSAKLFKQIAERQLRRDRELLERRGESHGPDEGS